MDAAHDFCSFSIPDLWRPSLLTVPEIETTSLFTGLELDVTAIQLHNPYAPKTTLENDLQLPSLESFKYGPLEDLELEQSVFSADIGEVRESSDDEDDIWLQVVEPLAVTNHCFSWERFYHGEDESQTPYLSEWGPLAFNAAVQRLATIPSSTVVQGPVAKPDVTLKALFDLALGRSSTLYAWDDRTKTFIPSYRDITSSGYTTMAFTSFTGAMIECGSAIKRLRKFADQTYSSSDIPSRVALATAVSTVVSGIEMHLTSCWPRLQSVLQLQQAVDKPRHLLRQMVDLVVALRDSTTDEQISMIMYRWCLRIEHESAWMSSIMLEVLSRISNPLLERMASWVGFQSKTIMGHSLSSNLEFIKASDSQEAEFSVTQYILDRNMLPDFVSADLGENVMEVGLGLKVLKKHHPQHILVLPRTDSSDISLQWKHSWAEVDSVVAKAQRYEQDLAAAVRQFSRCSSGSKVLQEQDMAKFSDVAIADDHESVMTKSLLKINEEPPQSHDQTDELLELVRMRMGDNESLAHDEPNNRPSMDLLASLSFSPLLQAQARLVKGACLRTLLRTYDLREHLRVQRSFHLLGNGVFVSRLSATLFDSAAETTERQLGVMRSGNGMGLKISDRQTWPPASSELRLALMGILNECYQASIPSKHVTKTNHLPGGLSFAIRSLSEPEIAKIMDRHSLHALDFLRLQYSPPSPINCIITASSLEKYDTIFKFLLRLIRLLFVVSRFPTRGISSRSTLSFCNQARHFINSCAAHFFDSAVGEPWSAFTAHVDNIASNLDAEDADNPPAMRDFGGIEDLRQRHDRCLDGILFGLFLRHRQTKILALLNEIFSQVLVLETLCSAAPVDDVKIEKLRGEFVDKVTVFLDVCRGLAGKQGYAADVAGDQGNMIERLVCAVDFNGFYQSLGRRKSRR